MYSKSKRVIKREMEKKGGEIRMLSEEGKSGKKEKESEKARPEESCGRNHYRVKVQMKK